MNDEQYRELLRRLERLDRRIDVLGDIILGAGSVAAVAIVYYVLKVQLGLDAWIGGIAAIVAWYAFWMTIGHEFRKNE